jgi:hypothetical protein
MFLMRFTERAYVHYTAEDVKNSPNSAVRLTFSNRHFDPQRGADLYNTYLDEYEYCEEVGFDGPCSTSITIPQRVWGRP